MAFSTPKTIRISSIDASAYSVSAPILNKKIAKMQALLPMLVTT